MTNERSRLLKLGFITSQEAEQGPSVSLSFDQRHEGVKGAKSATDAFEAAVVEYPGVSEVMEEEYEKGEPTYYLSFRRNLTLK